MSSKSKDKLPPLPRTPHTAKSEQQHQQLLTTTPIDMQAASSSNTANLPIEFDRSLNIRRSKRFVRQSAQTAQAIQQHMLTAQEIPLSTSPSQQAIMTTNSLQKAISTPSILDKLKSSTTIVDNCEEIEDKQTVANNSNDTKTKNGNLQLDPI